MFYAILFVFSLQYQVQCHQSSKVFLNENTKLKYNNCLGNISANKKNKTNIQIQQRF